jgi:UDP-N-acetylglucosamine transferase subunit ALG13
MASFEKMAKSLMEETVKTATTVAQLARDTALLQTVVRNQEVMIVQNQKMIELLDRLQTVLAEKEAE